MWRYGIAAGKIEKRGREHRRPQHAGEQPQLGLVVGVREHGRQAENDEQERASEHQLEGERDAERRVEINVALLHDLARQIDLFEHQSDRDPAGREGVQTDVARPEESGHDDRLSHRQAVHPDAEQQVDDGTPPRETREPNRRRHKSTVRWRTLSRANSATS